MKRKSSNAKDTLPSDTRTAKYKAQKFVEVASRDEQQHGGDDYEQPDLEHPFLDESSDSEDVDLLSTVTSREKEEQVKEIARAALPKVIRKSSKRKETSWIHLFFETESDSKDRLKCILSDYSCSSADHPPTIAVEKTGTSNANGHFKKYHNQVFDAMEKGRQEGEDSNSTKKTIMASLTPKSKQLKLSYAFLASVSFIF